MNHWTLQGKKAIVTGATKGIGKAISEEFLQHGAEVLMISRSQTDLDVLTEVYEEKAWKAYGLQADVAYQEDRNKIAETCKAIWGKLDILVNNVGTNIRKNTLETTVEELKYVMNVNVESAFDLSKQLYEMLRKGENSTIINISSIASQITVKLTTAVYSMSKGALEQLTNYLAVEWGKEGIRINSVHPWYIRTPLVSQVLEDEEKRKRIISSTPLGRVGEPEDVARVVAFLAMPAASYVNGVNMAIDGGFSKVGMQ